MEWVIGMMTRADEMMTWAGKKVEGIGEKVAEAVEMLTHAGVKNFGGMEMDEQSGWSAIGAG